MLGHGIEAIRAHLATLPRMRDQTVEEVRKMYDKAQYVFALPDGVEVERGGLGGVPAETLTPPDRGAGTLLYFHGGGYAIGSPASHRHLVAAIAAAARVRAHALDYPARAGAPLSRRGGRRAGQLSRGCSPPASRPRRSYWAAIRPVAGSPWRPSSPSATRGLALPAAGICISPWADLTNDAESYRTLAERDPLVFQEDIDRWRDAYLAGADPRAPLASPVHADLSGLPPLLIQVGSEEVPPRRCA